MIASTSITTLGWAGKRTGVIVGQGQEAGMVRIQLDEGGGRNEPQLWWEGHWLLRDSPETTKAIETFEATIQQTVNRMKLWLESDPQARAALREAMYRIEEEERREFSRQWAAEHQHS